MSDKAEFIVSCSKATDQRVGPNKKTREIVGSHLDLNGKMIDEAVEGLSLQITVSDARFAGFQTDDMLKITVEKIQPPTN